MTRRRVPHCRRLRRSCGFSRRSNFTGEDNLPVRLAICSLLALTASCDLSVDGDHGWQEIMGVLGTDSAEQVSMPDSAHAGVPFDVGFATHGICTRAGGTRVTLTANRAEIEPRDLVPDPLPQTCNLFPYSPHHRVTIRFDHPGPATVVVRGLREWAPNTPLDTLEIVRTVIIR